MFIKRENLAFSLIEAVIAIFLLSFAALSVLSLTQSGFVAQKRNQEIAKANLVVGSVISEIRVWAANINNFKSSWTPYNRTFTPTGFDGYTVTVRSKASGRPIDSPCAQLESQWEPTVQGRRTMPNAIVPVELVVSWSTDPRDSVAFITYVGEPKRQTNNIVFEVKGPSRLSVGPNDTTEYQVRAREGGHYLDNLMYQWTPDPRYVSLTSATKRDGRFIEIIRDKTVQLPDIPPPRPPALTPITCYARYAGTYLDAGAAGMELP